MGKSRCLDAIGNDVLPNEGLNHRQMGLYTQMSAHRSNPTAERGLTRIFSP